MPVSLCKEGSMNGDMKTLGNMVWKVFLEVREKKPTIHHCLASAERMARKPKVYRSFGL